MQIPTWFEHGKVWWNLSTDPYLHCDIFLCSGVCSFVNDKLWIYRHSRGTFLSTLYSLLRWEYTLHFLEKGLQQKENLLQKWLIKHTPLLCFFCAYINANVENHQISKPVTFSCQRHIWMQASDLHFSRQAFKSMISNLNQLTSLNVYLHVTTETEKVF